jgi:hypothetical protein
MFSSIAPKPCILRAFRACFFFWLLNGGLSNEATRLALIFVFRYTVSSKAKGHTDDSIIQFNVDRNDKPG